MSTHDFPHPRRISVLLLYFLLLLQGCRSSLAVYAGEEEAVVDPSSTTGERHQGSSQALAIPPAAALHTGQASAPAPALPEEGTSPPAADQPYDVFISHAGEDKKDLASPLHIALKERGIHSFFDRDSIEYGDQIPDRIIHAMDNSRIGLFILSPDFIAKKWPMYELDYFLQRHAEAQRSGSTPPCLFPIFYRGLTPETCKESYKQLMEKYEAYFFVHDFPDRMYRGETSYGGVAHSLGRLKPFKGFVTQDVDLRGGLLMKAIAVSVAKRCISPAAAAHRYALVAHYTHADFALVDSLFAEEADEVASSYHVKDLSCTLQLIDKTREPEGVSDRDKEDEFMRYYARRKHKWAKTPILRDDLFVSRVWDPHYARRKHKWAKTPILRDDLFVSRVWDPRKPARVPNKVLIIGAPGTGKTTLSKQLAYLWAVEEWGPDFDTLYLLPVRALRSRYHGSDATLPQAILNNCWGSGCPNSHNEAYKALLDEIHAELQKSTTLVILDGLDERSDVHEPLIKAARQGRHKLLMLSRSYRMSKERAMADIEVEHVGLSDAQVEDYIHNVAGLSTSKGSELLSLLGGDRAMSDIAQVPVNLQILCYLWQTPAPREQVRTALSQGSLSGLYRVATEEIWKRYESRSKALGATSEDRAVVFPTLEAIALASFKDGEILINEERVEDLLHSSGLRDPNMRNLQDTGFLLLQRLVCGGQYQFPHLTFHEYFAGSCLSAQLFSGAGEESNGAKSFFKAHRYDARYGRMLSFLAGAVSVSRSQGVSGVRTLLELANEEAPTLPASPDEFGDEDSEDEDMALWRAYEVHVLLQLRLLHECYCLDGSTSNLVEEFSVSTSLKNLFKRSIAEVRKKRHNHNDLLSRLTRGLQDFRAAARPASQISLDYLGTVCGDEKEKVYSAAIATLKALAPVLPVPCFAPLRDAATTPAVTLSVRRTAYAALGEAGKAAPEELAPAIFDVLATGLQKVAVRRAARYAFASLVPAAPESAHRVLSFLGKSDAFVHALVLSAYGNLSKLDHDVSEFWLSHLRTAVSDQSGYISDTARFLLSDPPIDSPVLSSPTLPSAAFGAMSWREYFGVEVSNEPPLPDDTEEILNRISPFLLEGETTPSRVSDNHCLVLIPSEVDGEPFTLDALEDLIQYPLGSAHRTQYELYPSDVRAQFGVVSPDKSYWLLLTRTILEGSRGERYGAQKAMVQKYSRQGYELPSALEAATGILAHYVRTGERLYGANPLTYTRCTATQLVNEIWPLVVGGFEASGLPVYHSSLYADSDVGVAGCWKL